MSLVELVGWSLVHSLWEGAVIAILLFGFLRMVDPRRSAVRYLVSALALLLVVVLPPLTALPATPPTTAPVAVPICVLVGVPQPVRVITEAATAAIKNLAFSFAVMGATSP